jgi:RHS repeat-associated protein
MTNIMKAPVYDPETSATVNPKWGFVYDSNGQLASVSDPKNRASQFTYDQLERTVTHKLPMGQTGSQLYDSFGRIFRKVDFKGQTNEFLYDSTGKLSTNRCYAIGSSIPSEIVSYIYDEKERTKQIIQPHGTNSFEYDSQGHVARISSPEGIINYEYEPVEGRRVHTYTANNNFRYDYDELGRLKTVTVTKRNGNPLGVPDVTTNTYTALGSLEHVYYPNGAQASYQYNLLNRLTNLVYTGNGQLLAQYKYVVNAAGQQEAATEIQKQDGGGYATNQLGWFYDNLGRLTNETSSSTLSGLNYTNCYIYDLAGNRLWLTNRTSSGINATAYAYNTNDQLITDGSFTNWYDSNGALTNRSSSAEANHYIYNLRNRLTNAVIQRTESGGQISQTMNFVYNASGIRVRTDWSRTGAGGANGTNIFLNDPYNPGGNSQVLEELPSVGTTPNVSYVFGNRIISQEKNGTISHLLSDGHNSTRLLASPSGTITARYNYDAYGKALGFSTEALNPPETAMLYSSGQFDTGLQLYPFGVRHYNPTVGRFNQIDPFSANQRSGGNLYAYCGNDPVNNSDPSGLYEIDVHQYLTKYLAGIAGFGSGAAINIGEETQAPDDDGRAAFYWGNTWNNMPDYHFVNRDRLIELAGNITCKSDYENIGTFCHAQEDTYAHCTGQDNRNWDYLGGPGGGIFGHACDGHDPDHTWLKPDKGVIMAMRVYIDLKNLAKDGKFSNNPNNETLYDVVYDPDFAKIDWSDDDMNKIVKFMWFNPGNVSGGMTKTWFGWDTVTQAGYLAKIQVLFPGYSLKEADAGDLKKLTPVKPLLSPRMQGIGVTTDMTVSGIMGGLCL